MADKRLQQSGDALLLEDGDATLLEGDAAPIDPGGTGGEILIESGGTDDLELEQGDAILLESGALVLPPPPVTPIGGDDPVFQPRTWIDRTDDLDAEAMNDLEARIALGIDSAGEVPTFKPETFGAVADGATDDTDALQACIDAALAEEGDTIVRLQSGATYLVNGDPRTDRGGASILSYSQAGASGLGDFDESLAIIAGSGYTGTGNSQQATIKTTRTGDDYDAGAGPPCVLGGKTDEGDRVHNTPSMGFMTTRNVKIQVPADPDIAGADFIDCFGFDSDMKVIAAGITAYATAKHAFGIRTGDQAGSAHMHLNQASANGMYASFVVPVPDHLRISNAYAYRSRIALAFQDPLTTNHGIGPGYFMMEGCRYDVAGWTPDGGVCNLGDNATSDEAIFAGLAIDLEEHSSPFDKIAVLWDINDKLVGELIVHKRVQGDAFPVFGANNLHIITTRKEIGATSAQSNWRHTTAHEIMNVTAGDGVIDYIHEAYDGRQITLNFNGNVTVTHNSSAGGGPDDGFAKVLLLGADDLAATNNTNLSLFYSTDDHVWHEYARKTPS